MAVGVRRGVLAAALLAAVDGRAADLVLRNARLLDGTGAPPRERTTVVVRAGRIAAIHPDGAGAPVADVPSGTPALDVGGATVLPGLTDAHVHLMTSSGAAFRRDDEVTQGALARHHLRALLACGVTTVFDPGVDAATARDLRAWLAGGGTGPRYLHTGPMLRPPGGYGSERYGVVATAQDVEPRLDELQALGAVAVKVAIEDALWTAGSGFDEARWRAIREGAARRGLPLVVHATSETAQREALDRGARALMHPVMGGRWRGDVWAPRDVSAAFVRHMREAAAFQVSTLSVLDTWPGLFAAARLDDPLVQLTVPAVELATARDPAAPRAFSVGIIGWSTPWVPIGMRPWLGRWLWTPARLADGLRYSQRNLRRLWEAGVPVVVGSDAPSPWPDAISHFHGPQTLREVELLRDAGLPAMAALEAATRRPAEMLGRAHELGTVEVGRVADLVIVRDDPLADVGALRSVRWVVQAGVARTPAEWMASP